MADVMQTRYRQMRNYDLYSVLNQAAGLPFQERPDPVLFNGTQPQKKHKSKIVWTIALVIGAALLIQHGVVKKGLKAL